MIEKNVEKRTWDEFRATGLLFFINSILHAFGWAFVVEVDYDKESQTETSGVKNIYPARVKFRGFDEQTQSEEHVKIAKYLADNSPDFPEEIK